MARSASLSPSGSRLVVPAMTAACSVDSIPSARACRVTGRDDSKVVARATSAAALAPHARVFAASQAPVLVIPARSAAP